MVGIIICEVGTITCDIGTINVRFYLLEVRYPHEYFRIILYFICATRHSHRENKTQSKM